MRRESTWQREGACVRHAENADWWFLKVGEHADLARSVCARCAVREPCLRYALDHNVTAGIWGGRTPSERQAFRRTAG